MSEPTPEPVPVPEDMKPFVNYHVVSGPGGKGLVLGQREGDPGTLWLVPIESPSQGFGLSLEAVKTLAGDLRSFLESWQDSGWPDNPMPLPWSYKIVPVYEPAHGEPEPDDDTWAIAFDGDDVEEGVSHV